MYDKLKFVAYRGDVGNADVTPYLEHVKEVAHADTGVVTWQGSLSGLDVFINNDIVSVKGSLSKFYCGNNINTLGRQDTKRAMQKINDLLHLDLTDADVKSIEFGSAFVMSRPVAEYFACLGDMPRMIRNPLSVNSLYYQGRGANVPKQYVFYDKIAECKREKVDVPVGLADCNILRYEMRLHNRLPYQLNVPKVVCSSLYDKSFYRGLVDMYRTKYKTIIKVSKYKADMNKDIKKVGDAVNLFVARLIALQGGQNEINAFVDTLKADKVFSNKNEYVRLRNKLQEIASCAKVSKTDALIQELNDAVENACMYD